MSVETNSLLNVDNKYLDLNIEFWHNKKISYESMGINNLCLESHKLCLFLCEKFRNLRETFNTREWNKFRKLLNVENKYNVNGQDLSSDTLHDYISEYLLLTVKSNDISLSSATSTSTAISTISTCLTMYFVYGLNNMNMDDANVCDNIIYQELKNCIWHVMTVLPLYMDIFSYKDYNLKLSMNENENEKIKININIDVNNNNNNNNNVEEINITRGLLHNNTFEEFCISEGYLLFNVSSNQDHIQSILSADIKHLRYLINKHNIAPLNSMPTPIRPHRRSSIKSLIIRDHDSSLISLLHKIILDVLELKECYLNRYMVMVEDFLMNVEKRIQIVYDCLISIYNLPIFIESNVISSSSSSSSSSSTSVNLIPYFSTILTASIYRKNDTNMLLQNFGSIHTDEITNNILLNKLCSNKYCYMSDLLFGYYMVINMVTDRFINTSSIILEQSYRSLCEVSLLQFSHYLTTIDIHHDTILFHYRLCDQLELNVSDSYWSRVSDIKLESIKDLIVNKTNIFSGVDSLLSLLSTDLSLINTSPLCLRLYGSCKILLQIFELIDSCNDSSLLIKPITTITKIYS